MFHKAVNLCFLQGTVLEVTFQDGQIKQYDVQRLFSKYPQLAALQNRALFLSGRLAGGYGIIWNDELDLETETVYEDGLSVQRVLHPAHFALAQAIAAARAATGQTQQQVAALAGIDQSDFSKIERGVANPSLSTLERIAHAMGGHLTFQIVADKKREQGG